MKKLLIGLVFLMGNGLILGWTQQDCIKCYSIQDTWIQEACYNAVNHAGCIDCKCAMNNI